MNKTYAHKGYRGKCRNCKVADVNRPRGLCWSCYYKPEVRERFPSESKFSSTKNHPWNTTAGAKLPEPTGEAPGTPEKVAVLCYRAEKRQELFHPDDVNLEGKVGARLTTARPSDCFEG